MDTMKLKQDIALLLTLPKKLKKNFSGQGFSEVATKYGHLAFHVYQELDRPERDVGAFLKAKRVLLDPWTVINRFKATGLSIDDVEFWENSDVILSLVNYLNLKKDTTQKGKK
jgi:hypothetical protein